MHRRDGFVLRTALAAGMALLLSGALAATAEASSACDAVNGGAFNFNVTSLAGSGTRGPLTFAPGERLDFAIARVPSGDGARFQLTDDTGGGPLIDLAGNTPSEAASFTVTTASTALTVALTSYGASIAVTTTCVPAAPSGPSDSDRLRAVQVIGTKIVAQSSGQAIAGAVASGLAGSGIASGGATTGGGNGAPALLGPGVPGQGPSFLGARERDDRPAAATQSWRGPGWTAWASVNVSAAERRPNEGGFEGSQVNGLFGVGRFLTPDLVVGLLGGYETFGYDFPTLRGHLGGDGWTGGTYLAWQLTQAIRFDLAGAYSGLDYDARAGAASGTFEGRRWLIVTGLTGTYGLGDLVVEPSAQLFAVHEHQAAWKDSLGKAQAEASFDAARASAGARLAYPIRGAGGLILAPYVGLYADYYFSSDAATATSTTITGIGDGWSARATGGLAVGLDGGAALSIGGEWGGLGADHTQRSLSLRGALPF